MAYKVNRIMKSIYIVFNICLSIRDLRLRFNILISCKKTDLKHRHGESPKEETDFLLISSCLADNIIC